jgi:hypothetical protein
MPVSGPKTDPLVDYFLACRRASPPGRQDRRGRHADLMVIVRLIDQVRKNVGRSGQWTPHRSYALTDCRLRQSLVRQQPQQRRNAQAGSYPEDAAAPSMPLAAIAATILTRVCRSLNLRSGLLHFAASVEKLCSPSLDDSADPARVIAHHRIRCRAASVARQSMPSPAPPPRDYLPAASGRAYA